MNYEELRQRVSFWVAPIAGGSPAGTSAKFEPEYQAVAGEVAKLDMPAGGAVVWKLVNEKGAGILTGKSKDLVIAAYLAHAQHVTGGVAGLTNGCVLLVELMEQYWDTLFPEVKRLRGRANAVQWFVEKTTLALATPPRASLDEVEALEAAAVKLADVCRARLAEMAPAFGAILEVVARMKEAVAPPPAPEQQAAAAPGGSAPAAAAPATSPAPAPPAAPAEGADLGGFLRGAGASLVDVARRMRAADARDPNAYRVLRQGTWLGLTDEPLSEGGRTPIPPPTTRDTLLGLLQGQQWGDLLEAAEAAAAEDPLWLDPHRLSWLALGALGAAHEKARQAVVAEVRSLVSRLPALPGLTFSDGSPCADPATQAWLEEEVGKAPARGSRPSGGLSEAATTRLASAREQLSAGQTAEGLGAAREAAAAASSERERFLVRLEAARLYAGAGLNGLALATYQELDRQAQEGGLDDWEPALSVECLRGLIATARILADDPRGASPDLVMSHRRLSRLDPASAHELWP
ncbi:MAG: type VI secretion system protein TssA [Deltaproteobacteria bacterium]|nr:type VI secretion system protein TssA [Deltaproteobacteria bacterium]